MTDQSEVMLINSKGITLIPLMEVFCAVVVRFHHIFPHKGTDRCVLHRLQFLVSAGVCVLHHGVRVCVTGVWSSWCQSVCYRCVFIMVSECVLQLCVHRVSHCVRTLIKSLTADGAPANSCNECCRCDGFIYQASTDIG